MLGVLIRSALLGNFNTFLQRNKKNNYLIPSCIWTYEGYVTCQHYYIGKLLFETFEKKNVFLKHLKKKMFFAVSERLSIEIKTFD